MEDGYELIPAFLGLEQFDQPIEGIGIVATPLEPCLPVPDGAVTLAEARRKPGSLSEGMGAKLGGLFEQGKAVEYLEALGMQLRALEQGTQALARAASRGRG